MKPAVKLTIIMLCAFLATLVALYELLYLPLQDQTTTISAARPLAGTWTGTVTFTDRPTQTCLYQGPLTLHLTQNGDQLDGSFTATVTSTNNNPACVRVGSTFTYDLQGTVSSSAVHLTVADTDALTGAYTTNILTLRWQRCENCTSGPAITFVGMVSLTK